MAPKHKRPSRTDVVPGIKGGKVSTRSLTPSSAIRDNQGWRRMTAEAREYSAADIRRKAARNSPVAIHDERADPIIRTKRNLREKISERPISDPIVIPNT